MNKHELIDRLNSNATQKCWLIHSRPPDSPDVAFAHTLYWNENKYWRAVNRLSNWKYEWYVAELQLPKKFFVNDR